MAGVVGEAVDADAAGAGGIETVEAIEQAAVDERRLRQQILEPVGVGDFIPVAVDGKVAVVLPRLGAEAALADFGVEGGEKQVLQDGAVVGIAGIAVVILEQGGDPVFDKQLAGHQPFLLDEPDEQQPGDEPDYVFLGGQGALGVGGELGGVDRVLEPGEKLAVEAAVEFLGVQGVQPGVQQAVEVAGPAVVGDPAQAVGQGKLGQEVQVGAVGVGGVDFPHQRNAAHNIAVGVVAVGAAMDKGQGDPVVGGAEKRHGGKRESLVQFPRKGGVVAAGVIAAGKLHGDKQEAAGVAGVKAVGGGGGGGSVGGEHGVLRFRGDFPGDFAVGDLKEDLDGGCGVGEGLLGPGAGRGGGKLSQETMAVEGRQGQAALAAVAEQGQQFGGDSGQVGAGRWG